MVCPNCGGPLPALASESPFVRCSYCGGLSNVDGGVVSDRENVLAPARSAEDEERAAEARRNALVEFHRALEAAAASSPVSYPAFRELCERHLQVLGRTDSVARVAYNLALDAEGDLDDSLRTRGGALARLTVAYMDVVGELRNKPSHDLNLPFLFATPEGPRHYRRTLDAATIATLAEREPPSAPIAEKKGFWGRLFG